MTSSPASATHVLPVTIVVCLAGLLTGCTPAMFGILCRGQKEWHHRAFQLTEELKAGDDAFSQQELENRLGKPDAVVPGRAFASGHDEADQLLAYRLGLSSDGEDTAGMERLRSEKWKFSTILIYDEESRYMWPIAGGWRAYLFQIQDGSVVADWAVFFRWTPWQDDYWDDVREQMEDGN